MEAEVLGSGASTEAVAAANTFRVGPFDDPDRYEIGGPVEAGAEGILYRGRLVTPTSRLALPVAVKALQPAYAGRIEQWAARWRDQVEVLRTLQIPGFVGVREGFVGPLPHKVGAETAGRNLYLVMNWVEGEALDHWVLHHKGVDVSNALKLLLPVAVAIDTMHGGQLTGSVPVVHRDIKPANILVGANGAVLVDFGLTKGLSIGHPVGRAGTPGYIAPEVVAGGGYTPAADRYAFGATVFFLLTGRHPPAAAKPAELRQLLEESPGREGEPVSAELVDRVLSMLDPDPLQRPAALANWVAQLRQSSLDDEALTVRLAPPAPARPRRLGRGSRGGTGGGSSAPERGRSALERPGVAGGVGVNPWQSTKPSTKKPASSGVTSRTSSGVTSRGSSVPTAPGTFPADDPDSSSTVEPALARLPLTPLPGPAPAGSAPAHRRTAPAAARKPQHSRHDRTTAGRVGLASVLALALFAVGRDASVPVAAASGAQVAVGVPRDRSSAVIKDQTKAPEPATTVPDLGGSAIAPGPEPATTTTVAGAAASGPCFESFSPTCGPLKWKPGVVNRPISVSFTWSPPDPVVGQPVTFMVIASDPDDSGIQVNAADYGNKGSVASSPGSATAAGCPNRYGVWPAPQPGAPGRIELAMSFTYNAAGTYPVHFVASSGRPQQACGIPDPYASTGSSAVQMVTVQAPPPPATTTSTTVPPPPTTPPPTTPPTTSPATVPLGGI